MTLRPFSQTLQQQFRDTLGTPGSPDTIDDAGPVVPVAVVAQVNTASSASYSQITDGTDTMAITTAGAANVTDVGGLPPNATQVNVAQFNINTGATVYTVTSGKTFYCTGALWGGTTANNSQIRVAGTDKLTGVNPANQLSLATGGFVLVATSGQAITLTHSSGAGNGHCCLWGYEL